MVTQESTPEKIIFRDYLDVTTFALYVKNNPWMLDLNREEASLEIDWDKLFPQYADQGLSDVCQEITGGAGIPMYAFDAVRWLTNECGVAGGGFAICESSHGEPSRIVIKGRDSFIKMAQSGIDVLSRADSPISGTAASLGAALN